MYKEVRFCRCCGSNKLTKTLSLGNQVLTGVFPRSIDEEVTSGPVDLVWCSNCWLLQMSQSYSLDEMYGENYGYRSSLNPSMVRHLQNKIKYIESIVELTENDLVIDIGSNDGTLLKAYSGKHQKVGIDPTGVKFRKYYTDDILLIAEFFSKSVFKEKFPNKKAKVVTSIAMFYDLENPVKFAEDVCSVLTNDGIWHFEQSYMPSMLITNSYDTICHEHLEFYSVSVVDKILKEAGLRLLDVQLNDVNGGSFAVTACKNGTSFKSNDLVIKQMMEREYEMGLHTIKPHQEFAERALEHKEDLKSLIRSLVSDGKKVAGYGASTKGNVLLQFCNFTSKDLHFIVEVNEDKFGTFTPGTNIPIVSENAAAAMNPDYYLVLPWHFKNSILEKEKDFRSKGGKFIFPLPVIEIV